MYYKVLNYDLSANNGGRGKWHQNRWMPPVNGELVPCQNGYHVCRREDLINWLGPRIFECHIGDEFVTTDDKVVAREACLGVEVRTWNERTARLFAADCAAHVLHIYEEPYPKDLRPRKAIEAARGYVRGDVSVDVLAAARAAACDAARAAAWAAAGAAAWDAAGAAAWDAAGAAAWDAARAAAWAAAGAAAGDAEKGWQTIRLFEYLEGRA